MKILIAIPSKNRTDVLQKNALQWIPHTHYDWEVFVEPQDWDNYVAVLKKSSLQKLHLVRMDKNDQGLGYAKEYIKKYALTYGYTHVFKIDDDVRGFSNYRVKFPPLSTAKWFDTFMKVIEANLTKYPEIKAVSFPYSFEMYEKKEWELSKRAQTAYLVEVNSMYTNPKVSVFEDFATGLHILVNNGLMVKYGLAGIDMGVKVGGGTGGHQSFDRYQQALAEAVELRRIYPPLNFRQVDKPWKIEPDMSTVKYPHLSNGVLH